MKRLALTALSSVLAVVIPSCHSFAEVGDGWNHYGGSEKGLQYSSADQINLSNVNNLKEAWRFRTGELGEGTQRGYSFQNNPILVRGTLYISTGSGIIIAVDPKTGTEKWRYDPKFDRSKRASESANRGVSSWIDTTRQEAEACFHRIYIGTLDGRLIAVDGGSGKPCSDFGTKGEIDLTRDVRLTESESIEYLVTSPPVIVDETVITGSAIGDNRGVELELGIVRGFDVRTGALRWSFDPIPRSQDNPMYPSWNPEEAAKSGAANA